MGGDVAAERYKVPDAPKVSFYISERADENADERRAARRDEQEGDGAAC